MGFAWTFRIPTWTVLGIVAAAFGSPALFAQEELVQARLVADCDVVAPGDTVRIGARFKIADDWHIYWRNAGASGLPTSVKWSTPKELTVGALHWPMPTTHELPEIGTCYVYEKDVVIFAEMTVAKDARPGRLKIGAALSWLVCQESCVSGAAEPSIEIEVGAAKKESTDAALIARFAARVPTAPNAKETVVTKSQKKTADGKIAWTVKIAAQNPVDANRTILAAPRDDGGPTIESIAAKHSSDGAVEVVAVLSPRKDPKDTREKTAIFEIAFCETADAKSAQGSKLIERFLVIEGEIGSAKESKNP